MARALRLAQRALYTTTPNPRVGCVLVNHGRVVAEAWHVRPGEGHAEALALQLAGKDAKGATAYITLEPCSHHGRTPPCVDALIAAGVGRVVAAMHDPNPLVAGKGAEQLRAAGIAVEMGLMGADARELNIGFASRMERGRPWIRSKIAASLDGKTALLNGASQWITNEDARRDGHRLRARSCAMLTGGGTVAEDDPQLNVRLVDTPRQPARVIVDSWLETPPTARVLHGGGALIATVSDDAEKIGRLAGAGAEIVRLAKTANGKVDLDALAAELARRGYNEVTLEAGAKLNASMLQAGLIDEIVLYMAPILLGERAQGMFPIPELTSLDGKIELDVRDLRMIGNDLRIVARPKYKGKQEP
jgi:diaminohydroxyphosphoribosylaminopyrimidine deaminase/5-amino-6-(5-phosphoribosylamino)uracil reductase